jgi:hypothetical protein
MISYASALFLFLFSSDEGGNTQSGSCAVENVEQYKCSFLTSLLNSPHYKYI